MRKRKVWACAVLSAAMAASLMTGCGSSKTTDDGWRYGGLCGYEGSRRDNG